MFFACPTREVGERTFFRSIESFAFEIKYNKPTFTVDDVFSFEITKGSYEMLENLAEEGLPDGDGIFASSVIDGVLTMWYD